MLPLTELHAPDCHPFRVSDDGQMELLAESVKQYGVREPGLARTRPDGGYELLCGNRRKRACEIAGIDKMPVIVRELDDDLSVIVMVDSNLQQRETILPSEKAWAYRMKMEALNHNGVKGERLSCDIMEEQAGESKAQIFRFIRLTELVEKLLDMVDAKQLAINPAVELSRLGYEEQHTVVDCMAKYEVKPSLSQAVRLKKLNKAGDLTAELIDEILSEVKGQTPRETKEDKALRGFRNFFPESYKTEQMNEIIVKLLSKWKSGAIDV
jgi:ParB family chromosome partitioning protein